MGVECGSKAVSGSYSSMTRVSPSDPLCTSTSANRVDLMLCFFIDCFIEI